MGYISGKQKLIDEFIKGGKSAVNEPEYKLAVLRKWNSYTPIIPSDGPDRSVGGGYFLHSFGMGIVIVPGIGFVENFYRAGWAAFRCRHRHSSHTPNFNSNCLDF